MSFLFDLISYYPPTLFSSYSINQSFPSLTPCISPCVLDITGTLTRVFTPLVPSALITARFICSLGCKGMDTCLMLGETWVFPSHPSKSLASHVILTHACTLSSWYFSFVRWKLQSRRWRWQYIIGPPYYCRACRLRECGLTRFPFWVAHRWGRTADVLLSDCQYHKGTALYGRCRV